MTNGQIRIQGARQHNLKNIDLELQKNQLIIITGLSGSGKSSLAFDTLYAEGQRRYVESLSTHARQFLERMDKPDVDLIEGLSPAIAIEQKSVSHNPRSTVGTITEIHDFLRLLYARIGKPECYVCGRPITSTSIDEMLERLLDLPEKTRIVILAPITPEEGSSFIKIIRRLKKEGFSRLRIDGKDMEIDSPGKAVQEKTGAIEVVVDRIIIREKIRNRLADSIELALSLSNGVATAEIVDGEQIVFSEKPTCLNCGISFPELSPASFSFNSPHGACPACDGLGSTTEFDPELIIPNPDLSLREGAVLPWAGRNTVRFHEFIDSLVNYYHVDIYTPFRDLPERFRKVILHGSGKEEIPFFYEKGNKKKAYLQPFEGIIPQLKRRYAENTGKASREELKQYMANRPCSECSGSRLNQIARSVRINGLKLSDICSLSIGEASGFFNDLSENLSGKDSVIANRLLKEILNRLKFLENVGLSYLSIDRAAYTLSGGESQRIRLATQIGSKLTGVLYVLDEPSIGLHQRDNQRLLSSLFSMRDLGNTVLVVEHDEETIRKADYVVDMGPGGGIHGGEIVFAGKPEDLLKSESSLTGKYLSGRLCIETPKTRRKGNGKQLVLEGASENNLTGIDVSFPLGCFICVTGVSGSGKSTLVLETLNKALTGRLHQSRVRAGRHLALYGSEHVDKIVNIDQSPIGKTPRSNPGTYTGVFSQIRELFAGTEDARARGFKAGRFSFNIKGGRCEACGGDGIIRIEMHFLPDVYVACDICDGKRYNRETLEIRYKGKNIAEILDMTVNQSIRFFGKIAGIRTKLQTLADVGLGYIRIGQPATTLSGGEAQRIKLARELSRKATGRTLYILDEPTTGLHIDDIQKLLNVLNRLVDSGNTVIVIEHHLDVIKSADYIIDLGPEGGDMGGRIVVCGTPETVAASPDSHTGEFLKAVL